MAAFITLVESFGIFFFLVLGAVAMYLGTKNKNMAAVYMAIAFVFFSLREFVYLLIDSSLWPTETALIGAAFSFFGALVFLYVFIVEESSMVAVRKIAATFKP